MVFFSYIIYLTYRFPILIKKLYYFSYVIYLTGYNVQVTYYRQEMILYFIHYLFLPVITIIIAIQWMCGFWSITTQARPYITNAYPYKTFTFTDLSAHVLHRFNHAIVFRIVLCLM